MDGTTPCRGRRAVDPAHSPPKGRFVLRADSIRPYSGVCALNRVLAKIQRFGRMLCPYKVLFNAVSER